MKLNVVCMKMSSTVVNNWCEEQTSPHAQLRGECVVMPPARFSVMLADGESLVTLDKHSICRSIFSSVLVFPQRAVGDHCPTWLNLDSGLCL